MLSLLRLFSHQVEALCFRFLFFGVCWVLALDKLALGYASALGALYALIHFLPFALMPRLVPTNLNWLIALPLSRGKLWFLNYATNLMLLLGLMASYVFIAKAAGWTKDIPLEAMPRLDSFFLPFDSRGTLTVTTWLSDEPTTWLARLSWICFVHWRCLTLSPVLEMRGWYRHVWNHPTSSVRRAYRLSFVASATTLLLASQWNLPPMFWFSTAVIFFNVSPAICSAWSLGLPAPRRARWAAASLVPALALIAVAATLGP